MSGSSSERQLDPAVVMVEHSMHQGYCTVRHQTGQPVVNCEMYRIAELWADEYLEHTAAIQAHNELSQAYAALERQYLAAVDAHARLMDQLQIIATTYGTEMVVK